LREPLEVKRRVGYLPDAVGFYEGLSARANLRYTARLAGIPRGEIERRIESALHRVGLQAAADNRVKTFSRGMLQRLGLAEIVIKQAQVAILDEPTAALDPHSTQEFLAMIRGLKADGTSVLLSSHHLNQVQSVCDRVALFRKGRIELMGSVRELAQQVLGSGYGLELWARGEAVGAALSRIPGVVQVTQMDEDRFHIEADRDVRASAARTLVAHGCEVLQLGIAPPSLTEIYTRHFEGVRDAA
jgi:ABC-2 type transport system ATP-binding protein